MNKILFSTIVFFALATNTAATSTNGGNFMDDKKKAVQEDIAKLRGRNLKGPKLPKDNGPNPKGKAVGFHCCRPFRKEADSASCGVPADYTSECLEVLSLPNTEFCGCEWTGDDCKEIESCR